LKFEQFISQTTGLNEFYKDFKTFEKLIETIKQAFEKLIETIKQAWKHPVIMVSANRVYRKTTLSYMIWQKPEENAIRSYHTRVFEDLWFKP